MPQRQGLQDQTNRTLPVIRGFAEPSTSAHQWDFPLLDTQYSDLPVEAHRVEEEEDSQEEILEEEAADSQVEEDPCKVTLKEDHQIGRAHV